MPIRKNHGSISSTDSGHSEAMGYCDGNVYQLTSSILHNAPTTAAPLPPRRHSAVQQGSNSSSNLYHQQLMQPNLVVNSSTSKQANGDLLSMPPPPNPRTRGMPFPTPGPVIPGANITAYNVYASHQQQYNQLRHAGKFFNNFKLISGPHNLFL